MKNILLVIVVVLVIGFSAWYFTSGAAKTPDVNSSAANNKTGTASNSGSVASDSVNNSTSNIANKPDDADDTEADQADEEIKPATEVYKTAEEALDALRTASKSYDDSVLEQFSEPDPSCTWCDSLYSSLNRMIYAPETTPDEKSFYAEVLAISGRVNNIKTLVEGIKSAAKPEDADVFSEALELAVGKDDVTSYLGSQLNGANDTLRESLVAALTNQNSRLAAETLYKNTVERSDADGYYSSGIGLGEFIPDEEAMPFLQDAMLKHDQYSHLAVKALLNSGADGLKMVLDSLESSKDSDFDRKMLKDAVDHVSYDEEIEDLLKKRLDSAKQPATREFIQDALKSFSTDDTGAPADDVNGQDSGADDSEG